MTPVLLTSLASRRELLGDDLRVDAPRGVLTAELREEILAGKDELLRVLRRRVAEAVWEEAYRKVAQAWNRRKDRWGDAPWVEEDIQEGLFARLNEAILDCDLGRVTHFTALWRALWRAAAQWVRGGSAPASRP